MGKRYYCDYCDKTFPYNTLNRKKHNEGSQHQMLKNNYYAQFKDLKMIIDEEQQKRPCFKFFTHGYCNFGSQCRSSHKTSEELQYLKDMYTIECHNKIAKEEASKPKRAKIKKGKSENELKRISDHLTREDKELLEKCLPNYKLPCSLNKFNNIQLPPSLMPPEFEDFIDYDVNTWPC